MMLSILLWAVVAPAAYSQVNPQQAKGGPEKVTANEIKAVTDSVAALIEAHYVDKTAGARISSEFRNLAASGRYARFGKKETLSEEISGDLRKISNDGHLYVQGKKAVADDVNWEQIEQEAEKKYNYGFTHVEIRDDNIAYIRIKEFMHPKRSMQTAVAAMKLVENSDNLIIDLRGNGGGYPGIMEYVLNHYFEGEPIELSTTRSSKGENHVIFTSDLIYGKLRVGTPLYVLIDEKTASAAEYFAYTLQAFKKAVIVGRRSAGGANRNEYFDLPAGLRMSISVASPVNAITKTNWEGKGVIPDVVSDDPEQKTVELIRGAGKK
ncbi:S41 family peptidase [Dyadobacter fermentans]|uniref:S41 family peptidase n=1 Tax=Dyadobacter fermentans TaxID=94254 RepID=UPI001CBD2CF6|nr:S41 family peptidase [Dyadobacter fermentans]MBZ1361241.1 S41 family peptidase [Dyadobacter fermentans]